MIDRALCEAAFRDAVVACDPAPLVQAALARIGGAPARCGFAIGKAALAMARGAGPIERGVIVTNADDGRGVPAGWQVRLAAHPVPDERSLEAGDAVIDLVAGAARGERVLALVSGGASALCERLAPGVTLDQLRAEIGALAASGASIHELNARRVERSAIKGGKLARMAEATIVTLAISDVVGDQLAVIGSGPTIADRPGDRAELIAPLDRFFHAMSDALGRRAFAPWYVVELALRPVDDVAAAMLELMLETTGPSLLAWGEPTLRVPADHGDGGRAQQLALTLARGLRGTYLAAFVAGSDGVDGPPPPGRPAPAGAYVDGTTWDAIAAAGIDPARALARCDAGTALAAVGALVVTGPTGINHADVAIVG